MAVPCRPCDRARAVKAGHACGAVQLGQQPRRFGNKHRRSSAPSLPRCEASFSMPRGVLARHLPRFKGPYRFQPIVARESPPRRAQFQVLSPIFARPHNAKPRSNRCAMRFTPRFKHSVARWPTLSGIIGDSVCCRARIANPEYSIGGIARPAPTPENSDAQPSPDGLERGPGQRPATTRARNRRATKPRAHLEHHASTER